MTIRRSIHTPLGTILATLHNGALTGLSFDADTEHHGEDPLLDKLSDQLDAYFSGQICSFDLPLAPRGTAFQQRVWATLRSIPHGQTRSYSSIAKQIGNPKAIRAVGAANGANPIAIIIPCHRVIASNGTLHGYAGGLDRKRWLLDLETRSLFARSSC